MSFIAKLFGGGGPSPGEIQARKDKADRDARAAADAERKVAEEKAAKEAKETRSRRRGAAANIFTSPQGLANDTLLTSKLSAPL